MLQEDPNLFKILVASDIHVGYMEKDNIRGEDSFRSFEEVLEIAKERNVDFILLGGDLFHENHPSAQCLIRTTEALRKYCQGDDEVKFELISDQKENFKHTKEFPHVNFEDANLNISLPVFSIHGNHDDPTGKNPLCYLEAISASGLINYFGKYMDTKENLIKPLLLRKGNTLIALYGLGSLPEERLHRMFQKQAIKFLRPEEDADKWFNMFVVHQNRVPHGTKYLPEKFLTKLPHLVVWGHEHESITELQYNNEEGFYVLQPGSTVSTSLCEYEAKPKHVCLLQIYYNERKGINEFQKEFIQLKTVRQMIFDTLDLDKECEVRKIIGDDAEARKEKQVVIEEKIQSMIDQAYIDRTEGQPELPLIRLRVLSTGVIPFHEKAFGLQFNGKVANKDIVLFKRKTVHRKIKTEMNDAKLTSLTSDMDTNKVSNIEDIVSEYFKDEKDGLKMIDERGLTQAVRHMVEKEVNDSVETFIENLRQKVTVHVTEQLDAIDDDKEVETAIKDFSAKERAKNAKESSQVEKIIKNSQKSTSQGESQFLIYFVSGVLKICFLFYLQESLFRMDQTVQLQDRRWTKIQWKMRRWKWMNLCDLKSKKFRMCLTIHQIWNSMKKNKRR